MYIWPSKTIRDSFKVEYLRKLECNLQRMKIEKQQRKRQQKQSSANQKLLDNNSKDEVDVCETVKLVNAGGIIALCHDFLMLLSCCCCCFCCGACIDEEE